MLVCAVLTVEAAEVWCGWFPIADATEERVG